MDALLPIAIFLAGLAVGGGGIWLLLKMRIADAREQERDRALADIREAQTLCIEKDKQITRLESELAAKKGEVNQQTEKCSQLERDQERLQVTLAKEREKIDEKLALLNEAEKHFREAFQALAAKALENNTQKFDALYSKPVKTTLEEIKQKIALVDNTATNLGVETSKLVSALQRPEVRGDWGEMHLRRVVEVTGMAERCDFIEQQIIGESDAQQQPDMVVKLPGDRNIAVDAKAPIRSFLEAADAADDQIRQAKLQEFVRHVRERIKGLGSKAYHQNLESSPEFVVLYLPTEAVFSAALSLDGELLEFAAKYRVHLAGPTVLITLLRAVAHGWKQDALEKHAKEICTLGEELYKRLAVFVGKHLVNVGKALNESVTSYNEACRSLETRVMPQLRRFEQIGAAPADRRLEGLSPINTISRSASSDDFPLLDSDEADGELEEQEALPRPR